MLAAALIFDVGVDVVVFLWCYFLILFPLIAWFWFPHPFPRVVLGGKKHHMQMEYYSIRHIGEKCNRERGWREVERGFRVVRGMIAEL